VTALASSGEPSAAGPVARVRAASPVRAASLLVAVPLVVALAGVRSPRWYPAGDFAQAELHVRAVPRHLPLVGAAARVGTIFDQGSHPGPAGALALAVPYRVLGASSWALMAATVVLHLAAGVGAVAVARRVGGAGAAWLVVALLVVMARGFGAGWFLEPWNPWFGLLPFLLTLLLVWGVWAGDGALLPWFVLSASFCVQVHLGYGLLAVGLGIVVVVRTAWLGRRGAARPAHRRRWVLVSLAVLAAAWALPVVDELTRDPGNITRLYRHLRHPAEPYTGLRRAASAFVNAVNLGGTWTTGWHGDPSRSPTAVAWLGFAGFVALVGAGASVAWRRRDRAVRDAWVVAGVALLLSAVTLLRIPGPIYDYIIPWLVAVAGFAAVVAVWSLWRAVPTGAMAGTAVLGGVLVMCTGAATLGAFDTPVPLARDSALTAALAPPAVRALPRDAQILLRFHDPVSLGAPGIGVLLELERRGFHVGVDPWLRANAMPHRVMALAEADTVVWVVTGERAIADTAAMPGAVELASADVRTPVERDRSAVLRARVEEGLRALGRDDLVVRLDEQYGVSQVEVVPGLPDALLADLRAYRELRLPGAVFTMPAAEVDG
jgi:hypothetical protein